jgi:hypothetical protein
LSSAANSSKSIRYSDLLTAFKANSCIYEDSIKKDLNELAYDGVMWIEVVKGFGPSMYSHVSDIILILIQNNSSIGLQQQIIPP